MSKHTHARPRAVFYLRLSVMGDENSQSLATQESDLRAEADRRGWDVLRVFSDDGFSGGKARANAQEALRMLRDGEADVLAVWKFDRWSREGVRAVADLADVLDKRDELNDPALFVAFKDGWDSSADSWRLTAAVMAEIGRAERKNTALRVASAINALREHGRFAGGTVPYGFRTAPNPAGPGRILTPDAAEAEVIREAAARVLTGEAPYRICLDLNEREIPAPRSEHRRIAREGGDVDRVPREDGAFTPADRGTWRVQSLRRTLTGEHLLGRVIHRGEPIRGADGMPLTVWGPILTAGDLARLRKVLLPNPEAPKGKRVRRARLLSGLVTCAECGARLYVRTSSGRPVYGCPARQNGESCSSPRVMADTLEALVVAEVRERLGDLPMTETVTDAVEDDAAAAELAEVEAELARASASLLSDDVDTAKVVERIAQLKNKRASLRAETASPEILTFVRETGKTWSETFDEADNDDLRRDLLLLAFDGVRIAPMKRRTNVLDKERVEIEWTDPETGLRAMPAA